MAPVPDERVALGVHVYVVPPLAVKLTEPPVQIDAATGFTVIFKLGLIFTIMVPVPEHPFWSVPVTV